jgi:hypothetical protein
MLDLFLPYLMEGNVSEEDFKLLETLHEISSVLGSKINEDEDYEALHILVVSSAKQYEAIYGEDAVKPNHRNSLELADCLYSYGTSHSFWLFPLERVNGMLKEVQKSTKGVEVTMFRAWRDVVRLRNMGAASGGFTPEVLTGMTSQQLEVVERLRRGDFKNTLLKYWKLRVSDELKSRIDEGEQVYPYNFSCMKISNIHSHTIFFYLGRYFLAPSYFESLEGSGDRSYPPYLARGKRS